MNVKTEQLLIAASRIEQGSKALKDGCLWRFEKIDEFKNEDIYRLKAELTTLANQLGQDLQKFHQELYTWACVPSPSTD